MNKEDSPYEILGVDEDADESTIKKAYFKLARQYHPDKQTSEEDKQRVNSMFAKISDAYDLLNDPVRKCVWEKARAARQNRPRSRSPMPPAQRRPSTGSIRSPSGVPRNIRTTKRSVSPVPPKGNKSTQRPSNQPRSQRSSLSPMAHRTRRPTSPMPPQRHGSSGGVRKQSPVPPRRQYNPASPQRPQTVRTSGPSSPSQSNKYSPSSSSLKKPQAVRRASSGPSMAPPIFESSSSLPKPPVARRASSGPSMGPPISSIYWASLREENENNNTNNSDKPQSYRSIGNDSARSHGSHSSRGNRFQFRLRSNKASADADDDNDSFIGDDEEQLKSSMGSLSTSKQSRRSTTRTSPSPKIDQDSKKKVSILSALGLPGKRNTSPKPSGASVSSDGPQNKKGSIFTKFSFPGNNKNATPVSIQEEAPTKIEINQEEEPSDELPVKKIKKKKKKTKTNLEEDNDDDKDTASKKLKKKGNKKKKKKQPKSIDFSWKRQESSQHITMECSNCTGTETREGSSTSLGEEYVVLAN